MLHAPHLYVPWSSQWEDAMWGAKVWFVARTTNLLQFHWLTGRYIYNHLMFKGLGIEMLDQSNISHPWYLPVTTIHPNHLLLNVTHQCRLMAKYSPCHVHTRKIVWKSLLFDTNLQDSLYSIIHCFIANHPTTNTDHVPSYHLLQCMMTYFFEGLTQGSIAESGIYL